MSKKLDNVKSFKIFNSLIEFKNILSDSIILMSNLDQKKLLAVTLIQFALTILDLIGVALIGVLGALTISGVSWRGPSSRITNILSNLGLANLELKNQVVVIGIASTLFLILKSILSLYLNRKILYFLSNKSAEISSALLKKLLNSNLEVINKRSVQETIFATTNGVQLIFVGILGQLMSVLTDLFMLIMLIFGLLIADTLTAAITVLLFVGVGILLNKLMKQHFSTTQGHLSKILVKTNESTNEVILSYREIFSRDRQFFYALRIGQLRKMGANLSAEIAFLQNISKYVIELILVIGVLLIIGIQFATQPASHAIAITALFIAAATRIAPSVLRIQQGLLTIRGNSSAAYLTFELIEELNQNNSNNELSKKLPDLKYDGFQPTISLENLHFSYPANNHFKIEGLNLNIQPGQVLALVGTSGSGKTTLVDLFLGILQPIKGKVLISGTSPIDSIRTWPGAIAYVPQDVFISNGTIRENVTLGYDPKDFPDSVITSAIETAQLTTLVKNSTNGLETHIGERGTKISGGQRQRIGIARALLTQPKLLVLDEATSSLDSETEANLTEAIRKLRGKSTLVLIAHRLSTVKEADLVVYMENGKVIATGKFEEVRAKVPNFDKQAQLMGL